MKPVTCNFSSKALSEFCWTVTFGKSQELGGSQCVCINYLFLQKLEDISSYLIDSENKEEGDYMKIVWLVGCFK